MILKLNNISTFSELYHTVSYQINNVLNDVSAFFVVDLGTGLVTVAPNALLDRDGDQPTHRILLNLFDNFYFEGGL